jgi:hypothetical protein
LRIVQKTDLADTKLPIAMSAAPKRLLDTALMSIGDAVMLGAILTYVA